MTKERPLLVLLDTHAIIHRSYHAIPDLVSPSGEPTGALFGLSNMLVRIAETFDPDYVVAAYDLAGPTIRHHAYDGYKGTREKGDDALYAQIESARELLSAFGIPIYARPGFEADDVIASITEALKGRALDVLIASGDMDTLQLVEEEGRVRVFTLRKGLTDTVVYDRAAVIARYGFPPEVIPDYKGLAGDSSDNIKGVPGIGEKTATALIQEFGTLEGIYDVCAEGGEGALVARGVKPRIAHLLVAHEEDARFSKALATVRRDAPVSFALPPAPWRETLNKKKLSDLFDRLAFRAIRGKVSAIFNGGDSEIVVRRDKEEEEEDPLLLAEARVMAWLLDSDLTNPSREEVCRAAGRETIAEAHATLTTRLGIVSFNTCFYFKTKTRNTFYGHRAPAHSYYQTNGRSRRVA